MQEQTKDKVIFFLLGIFAGMAIALLGGICIYKIVKGTDLGINLNMMQPKQALPSTSANTSSTPSKNFLLSFENNTDLDFFQPEGNITAEVSMEHATDGSKSLMVKIQQGSDFPGIVWEVYGHGVQNWNGAKEFQLDIYNNTEENVSIEIKFKSGRDYPKKSYSYHADLAPLAMNNIRIPLSSIGNMCDLSSMSYVKIFATSVSQPIVLYMDNIGVKQ